MKEVYILERMLAPGVWEKINSVFYEDKNEAISDLENYVELLKKFKKDPTARLTTLENNNIIKKTKGT